MACFIVPTAEAVIVTAVKKIERKKEAAGAQSHEVQAHEDRVPLARKLTWLANMLWGGAVLLAFEHIWHGEVTLWFPFLTAMNDAEEMATMLHEMATVGVSMAVLISIVWIGMCIAADAIVRRHSSETAESTR
ncbi:MAG: hypothetical protein K6C95_06215 [Lachnospiraceae bacterium]|nr:hypothetical protein [Lachnospiraceae bacterium]